MENEIPKYRKKKSNSSKSEKKSDHKHEYAQCVRLSEVDWKDELYPYRAEYCGLGGKLKHEHLPICDGKWLNTEETLERYSDLPAFHVKFFADYVDLNEVAQ